MSVLDERVLAFRLFADRDRVGKRVEIGHVQLLPRREGDNHDWIGFILTGMERPVALPAREAGELGLSLLAIAQGTRADGLPRMMGVAPEREELRRLVDVFGASSHESTDAQAAALNSARDTLARLDEEEETDEDEDVRKGGTP